MHNGIHDDFFSYDKNMQPFSLHHRLVRTLLSKRNYSLLKSCSRIDEVRNLRTIARAAGPFEHFSIRESLRVSLGALNWNRIMESKRNFLDNIRDKETTPYNDHDLNEYIQQINMINLESKNLLNSTSRSHVKDAFSLIESSLSLGLDLSDSSLKLILEWMVDGIAASIESLDAVHTTKHHSNRDFSFMNRQSLAFSKPVAVISFKSLSHLNHIYLQWQESLSSHFADKRIATDLFHFSLPLFLRYLAQDLHADIRAPIEVLRIAMMFKKLMHTKYTASEIDRQRMSKDKNLVQLFTLIADKITIFSSKKSIGASISLYILSVFTGQKIDMRYSIFAQYPPNTKNMYPMLLSVNQNESLSKGVDNNADEAIAQQTEDNSRSSSHPILQEMLKQISGRIHTLNSEEYITLGKKMLQLSLLNIPPPRHGYIFIRQQKSGASRKYGESLGDFIQDMILASPCMMQRDLSVANKMKVILQGYEESRTKQSVQRSDDDKSDESPGAVFTTIDTIFHAIKSSSRVLVTDQLSEPSAHNLAQFQGSNKPSLGISDDPLSANASSLYRNALHRFKSLLNAIFNKSIFSGASRATKMDVQSLVLGPGERARSSENYIHFQENNNGLEKSLRVVLRDSSHFPLPFHEITEVLAKIIQMSSKIALLREKGYVISKDTEELASLGIQLAGKLLFLARNRILFSSRPIAQEKPDSSQAFAKALEKLQVCDIFRLVSASKSSLMEMAHPRLTQSILDVCYARVFLPRTNVGTRPEITCPVWIYTLLKAFENHRVSAKNFLRIDSKLVELKKFYTDLFHKRIQPLDMPGLLTIFTSVHKSRFSLQEELISLSEKKKILSSSAHEKFKHGRSVRRSSTALTYKVLFDTMQAFTSLIEQSACHRERHIRSLDENFYSMHGQGIVDGVATFMLLCSQIRNEHWRDYCSDTHVMFQEHRAMHLIQNYLYEVAPFNHLSNSGPAITCESALSANHAKVKTITGEIDIPRSIHIYTRFSSPGIEILFLNILKNSRSLLFTICSPHASGIDEGGRIRAFSDRKFFTLALQLLDLWNIVFTSPFSSFSNESYYKPLHDAEVLRIARSEFAQNEECERRVLMLYLARISRKIAKTGIVAHRHADSSVSSQYTMNDLCDIAHMVALLEGRRLQKNQVRIAVDSRAHHTIHLAHYNKEFQQFFSTHECVSSMQLPQAPAPAAVFGNLLPVIERNVHQMGMQNIHKAVFAFFKFRSPSKRILDAMVKQMMQNIDDAASRLSDAEGDGGGQKVASLFHVHRSFVSIAAYFYFIQEYAPPKNFSARCFEIFTSWVNFSVSQPKNTVIELQESIFRTLGIHMASGDTAHTKNLYVALPSIYPRITTCSTSLNVEEGLPFAINPPYQPHSDPLAALGPYVFESLAPQMHSVMLCALPSIIHDVTINKKCSFSLLANVQLLVFAMIRPFCAFTSPIKHAACPLLYATPHIIVNFFDGLRGLINLFRTAGREQKNSAIFVEMASTLSQVMGAVVRVFILHIQVAKGLQQSLHGREFAQMPFAHSVNALHSLAIAAMDLRPSIAYAEILTEVYRTLYCVLENEREQFKPQDLEIIKRDCARLQESILKNHQACGAPKA